MTEQEKLDVEASEPDAPDAQRPARFQVLAVDGGGLKGIFAAAALAQLEADFETSLVDHFDLIAGTSTGGLIALGLAAGMSAQEIVDFYLANQERIFPRRRLSGVRRLRRPYDPQPLAEALGEVFGARTLGECETRLTIPSYSLTSNDVYLFRTPHLPTLRRDHRELLVDVALATSAAPTFFPVHDLRGVRLIDGGVWANNPSMVGVVEGARCSRAGLEGVHLLNVGTTTELSFRSRNLDTGGMLRWAPHITTTVLRGQAIAAFNHAKLLLGAGHAHRLDVTVPAGRHRLDRVDATDLMGHAAAQTRDASPRLAELFHHRATGYRATTVQP